jgi:hypothetical protein
LAATLAWIDGGTASIDSFDDDRLSLTSSRPFAPGSRPEGTLDVGSQRIWIKVHGSRRQDDGSFRVNARLINATRELRQLLKEAVPGPIGGKDPTS